MPKKTNDTKLPHYHQDQPNEYRETISSSSSRKSHQQIVIGRDVPDDHTDKQLNQKAPEAQARTSNKPNQGLQQQQQQHQSLNNHHHHYNHNNNYDKVLLTLQDQYIPTLPKVIITASASVSDASGKKFNYSVGNVIGTNVKIPPPSYDEYKEDDVVLDPFFLDVPKIKPRRITKRDLPSMFLTKMIKKKRKK